ncbi:hypothetical protein GI374_07860 [Paracoccus sp. S-4012]|uniref:sulfotransferase family 2 domain-containing protein n=1 Tax=Paracoccus sp. S-4012 TaxID=2665648 RepID=UPI0012AFDF96|nr:sulfotransferase family 2 domain-containing protein [Paracoccus sp. S-4012]MRX50365.1 hypothetical protein [Paracoccus sp. S-4012]
MRFGDLDHMPLAEFVASAPQEALWFFVHVPKTAGSSFSAELARDMRPYTNVHVTYGEKAGVAREAREAALQAFIAGDRIASARSASGHMPFNVSACLRETRPDTQYFSILRAPVARVVSDYRYQRTPAHPSYREFIDRFASIEDWIGSAGVQNKMAKFLTGLRQPSIEETLRIVDEDYAFIGLLEMYPMSFNLLFSLMGVDGKQPEEHRRKTPDTDDTRVEMTPALERRIKELNAVDVALYEHVRRRLRSHREAWQAMRRERAAAARRAGRGNARPADRGDASVEIGSGG